MTCSTPVDSDVRSINARKYFSYKKIADFQMQSRNKSNNLAGLLRIDKM